MKEQVDFVQPTWIKPLGPSKGSTPTSESVHDCHRESTRLSLNDNTHEATTGAKLTITLIRIDAFCVLS
jgi:hypothetical protein